MEKMEFSVALASIGALVSRTNKYIDETQPWVLAKDENRTRELASVMRHLAEGLRTASILLQPFLTQAPAKIWEQLGIAKGELTTWDSGKTFGLIPAGTKLVKGAPIFPRLDVEQEVTYIASVMGGGKKAAEAGTETPAEGAGADSGAQPATAAAAELEEEHKEEIGIDDFAKSELRVAQVLAAEPVKGRQAAEAAA